MIYLLPFLCGAEYVFDISTSSLQSDLTKPVSSGAIILHPTEYRHVSEQVFVKRGDFFTPFSSRLVLPKTSESGTNSGFPSALFKALRNTRTSSRKEAPSAQVSIHEEIRRSHMNVDVPRLPQQSILVDENIDVSETVKKHGVVNKLARSLCRNPEFALVLSKHTSAFLKIYAQSENKSQDVVSFQGYVNKGWVLFNTWSSLSELEELCAAIAYRNFNGFMGFAFKLSPTFGSRDALFFSATEWLGRSISLQHEQEGGRLTMIKSRYHDLTGRVRQTLFAYGDTDTTLPRRLSRVFSLVANLNRCITEDINTYWFAVSTRRDTNSRKKAAEVFWAVNDFLQALKQQNQPDAVEHQCLMAYHSQDNDRYAVNFKPLSRCSFISWIYALMSRSS